MEHNRNTTTDALPRILLAGVVPNQRYPLPDNALGLQSFMVLRHRVPGRAQSAGFTWQLFVNSDLPTIYPPNEKGFVRTWLSPDDARADLARQLRELGFDASE